MKKLIGVVVLLLSACASPRPSAEGEAVCAVTAPNDAGYGTTFSPAVGTCTWVAGATVAMQCTQKVCYNVQGAIVKFSDGGIPSGPVASCTGDAGVPPDLAVDFTTNPDPYLIYLSPNEKQITVQASTTTTTCTFAKSPRVIR